MSLKGIKKEYKRVMGIDASSNTFAFAIIDDGTLVAHGEFEFKGNHNKRLVDERKFLEAFAARFGDLDAIAIEKPIFVNSTLTASILSQSAGVVKSVMAELGPLYEVVPTEWYKVIGNKQMTKVEKEAYQKENPGLSASKYKAEFRQMRKQFTIDWVKDNYGAVTENDNVADAIGVAHWLHKTGGKE